MIHVPPVWEYKQVIDDAQAWQYVTPSLYGLKGFFSSPVREDKHPSCKWYSPEYGSVFIYDHSLKKALNWQEVYAKELGVSRKEAYFKVATAMESKLPPPIVANPAFEKAILSRSRSPLGVNAQPLSDSDYEFWKAFGISKGTLEHFNVSAAKRVFVGDCVVQSYSEHDPIYCYDFYDGDFKFYNPLRSRTDERPRFMGNCPDVLQGWHQLPKKGLMVVLTKSYKDVMALYEYGIPAIAEQSEAGLYTKRIITELKTRFKIIATLYDFDMAGIHAAWKLREEHDIDYTFFLTNGKRGSKMDFGSKDFSDYRKTNGHSKTLNLIHNAITNNRGASKRVGKPHKISTPKATSHVILPYKIA